MPYPIGGDNLRVLGGQIYTRKRAVCRTGLKSFIVLKLTVKDNFFYYKANAYTNKIRNV